MRTRPADDPPSPPATDSAVSGHLAAGGGARAGAPRRGVRDLADRYVRQLAQLDPLVATALGLGDGVDGLPDLSPAGADALADLRRGVLRELGELAGPEPAGPEPAGTTARGTTPAGSGEPGTLPAAERRCAALLQERLTAELSRHDADDHLRSLSNLFSPVQRVRLGLQLMPAETADDWAAVGRRLGRVAEAYQQYGHTLLAGVAAGAPGGPAQVGAVVRQLDDWLADADGAGWFAGLAAGAPDAVRDDVASAAATATAGAARLRDLLAEQYGPAVADRPDAAGRDRYLRAARFWTGADLDVDDAYDWGWEELSRLRREAAEVAAEVLPGAGTAEAAVHLDTAGEAIEGVAEVRAWLQDLMDGAIDELDGRHVDVPGPVRRVEAMIAPPGSAAAPYYTRPSLDFRRPGRTWLPTLGQTRFPVWQLVSTWYHEGVPGHHLQLGTWAHLAGELSVFQRTVGSVSATTEGWALYAERLMAELGFLADPGRRLGFLSEQCLRAARVVVDIGLHTDLPVPRDAARRTGLTSLDGEGSWTPGLARRLLAEATGLPPAFVDSEVVRYLGEPGQAIAYKLGERAWLAGREEARRRHVATGRGELDLRAWHTAALSLGSLGLDDLAAELAVLP